MKYLRLGIIVTALLVFAGFMYWYMGHRARWASADPAALEALVDDKQVVIDDAADWIVFRPVDVTPKRGFIFYPGGEVDPRGYAEPLREIAAAGYLAVIVPMPFGLAVLAPGRAADVIEAFPQIKSWAIGGHSLGGAMAARFVYRNPSVMDGLLLWDAYPAESDDLVGREIPTRLVHRSDKFGRMPDYYRKYLLLLPLRMDSVGITGASHINFGRFYLVDRFRDNVATIPLDEQHAAIVAASVDFLDGIHNVGSE